MNPDWLIPDWPAPTRVRAFMTTRAGGVSLAPWDSMNPAGHVDDNPASVAENRAILRQDLPSEPLWLNQVHGIGVAECGMAQPGDQADAGLARCPGKVCAVLTADCLPALFCDRAGTVVAAAHAGWRGLAADLEWRGHAEPDGQREHHAAWRTGAGGPGQRLPFVPARRAAVSCEGVSGCL